MWCAVLVYIGNEMKWGNIMSGIANQSNANGGFIVDVRSLFVTDDSLDDDDGSWRNDNNEPINTQLMED